RPPNLLRSARARIRARDQETPGLLGEAAKRKGWGLMLQRLLLGAVLSAVVVVSPALAVEPFVGRWAVTPEICNTHGGDTAKNSALVATDTSLWWFDGQCRIGKMYKAKAVYVQAHCGAKDVSVTLEAQGDRMRITWDRKVEELKRCK